MNNVAPRIYFTKEELVIIAPTKYEEVKFRALAREYGIHMRQYHDKWGLKFALPQDKNKAIFIFQLLFKPESADELLRKIGLVTDVRVPLIN